MAFGFFDDLSLEEKDRVTQILYGPKGKEPEVSVTLLSLWQFMCFFSSLLVPDSLQSNEWECKASWVCVHTLLPKCRVLVEFYAIVNLWMSFIRDICPRTFNS